MFFFLSTPDLRDFTADRREILHDAQVENRYNRLSEADSTTQTSRALEYKSNE